MITLNTQSQQQQQLNKKGLDGTDNFKKDNPPTSTQMPISEI